MSFTEWKKKTIIDYTPKGGGGVLPIMAYMGRPRPKGVGKSVILVCKKAQKGL